MVLRRPRRGPVRKEVRQTIGPKISSNFGNVITDFWKTARWAERLLPRGKELCCSAAGLSGLLLSAVLVAGHRGRLDKRLGSSSTALTIWHAPGNIDRRVREPTLT